MKPRILPEDIEGLSFVDYRKLFIKELKRMKSTVEDGQSLNYMMITEWSFPDFPSKELPLIVIGIFRGTWEKYYKSTARKRSEKDFSIGNCSFGKDAQNQDVFNLEIRHGRIKTKGARALDKVILNKIGLSLNIVEKGGSEDKEEEFDESSIGIATSSAGVADQISGKEPLNKMEAVALLKAASEKLKKSSDYFKKLYVEAQEKLNSKLKTSKIGKEDLLIVKELQAAYSQFMEDFEEADSKLQQKFSTVKSTITKQQEMLKKLALTIRSKQKSLAANLSDRYFQKKEGRTASAEEVEQMKNSLKKAIEFRKISVLEGQDKKLNLKAIYLCAELLGPAFQAKHTDQAYQKLLQL